jgi:Zn finger protein HypA/HybF involved in hydrogenase expression
MIRKRLYDTVGDEYTLVSDYTSGTSKINLLHSKCNNIYSVTPNHFFYDNSRCKCQWNIKQPDIFEKEFNKVSKDSYTQLEQYRRNHSKISIRHEDCGTIFRATPHSFLQGKGCPECSGNKTKTTEEFSKEVDELTDGEYSLLTEYTNNRTYVTIKHIECGRGYSVIPKDFLRGNRCPFCKQSKGEKMVQRVLDEITVRYEIQKSFDDLKSNCQKLPFDFFLPDYNLLIEYDGIQHFKEVQYFGGAKKLANQKRRDHLKNKYAKSKNIKLLRIPYTYPENKIKEVILSYF